MRNGGSMLVLAVQLLLVVACGQSDGRRDNMETVHAYSLCPKTGDARERLSDYVKNFSDQQQARLIDRGRGAHQELSNIGSAVLDRTGGAPILLTVEKPDVFRISVTNLGLREKVALTIRLWNARSESSPVSSLMEDLSRFWTIQEVEAAVTDDPPCSSE